MKRWNKEMEDVSGRLAQMERENECLFAEIHEMARERQAVDQ